MPELDSDDLKKLKIDEIVVNLSLRDLTTFIHTNRPTGDFVIADNRVFFRDHFGGVDIYRLGTKGERSSSIFLPQLEPTEMATDESHLYLKIDRIDDFFLDNDDDMVLVREKNDSEMGFAIVGKQLRDQKDFPYWKYGAKKAGAKSSIFTIPLSQIYPNSYIWCLASLENENIRILIPEDFDEIHLFQRNGFVSLGHYNNYINLKNGKVIDGMVAVSSSGPITQPKTKESLTDKLRRGLMITTYVNAPQGLVAELNYYDPKLAVENFESQGIDRVSLPILIEGRNIDKRTILSTLLKSENGKDVLYLLHNQTYSERGSIIHVDRPAYLERFDVELKRTKKI